MDKEGNEAGQALWNRNQRGLLGELSRYMLWAEGMSGRCRADPKNSGRAVTARRLESRPKHGLQHRAVPARARTSPGRAVLVPGQIAVLRAVPSCLGLHGHLYTRQVCGELIIDQLVRSFVVEHTHPSSVLDLARVLAFS